MKITSVWRNFVLFCLTFLFSAFGFEFMFFVMTVHIYDLSKSVLNVSIFTVVNYIPKLFSPFLGTITDRFKKENTFSVVTILISVLIFLLGSTSNITVIYFIWFLISVLLTLMINIRSTLMADVLSNEKYSLGNTITLVVSNSARLLAPLIGGFITIILNTRALLTFTALIYLLTSLFSKFIKLNRNVRDNDSDRKTSGAIKEVINYIINNRVLLFLAILGCSWSLFLGFRVSIYVGYIENSLSSSKTYYGIFLTVIGLGSILGSILGAFLSKFFKHISIMTFGLSLHYITFSLLGIINNIFLAIAIVFISHIGLYTAVVGLHTLRDKGTSSILRGRVYGLVTALLTPSSIISVLVGGVLSNIFGIRTILICAGILGIVSLYVLIILIQPYKVSKSENINEMIFYKIDRYS